MRGRPRTAELTDPLAVALRAWRDRYGLSIPQAVDVLGVPQRTLEQIEQGRGFRYPALLLMALEKKLKKADFPY
jgi:transcriptional regulator with XRE-family HTH domain